MSSIMSCCVPSEQAKTGDSDTTTPGSSFSASRTACDVDVVGDVAAAVADVDADPALGRAGFGLAAGGGLGNVRPGSYQHLLW